MEQNNKTNCSCSPAVSHVHEMCAKCLGEWVQWQEENEQAQAHYADAALERGRPAKAAFSEYRLISSPASAKPTRRSKALRLRQTAAQKAYMAAERTVVYRMDWNTAKFEPAGNGEPIEQPEELTWPTRGQQYRKQGSSRLARARASPQQLAHLHALASASRGLQQLRRFAARAPPRLEEFRTALTRIQKPRKASHPHPRWKSHSRQGGLHKTNCAAGACSFAGRSGARWRARELGLMQTAAIRY
jgi:hypothetical protein